MTEGESAHDRRSAKETVESSEDRGPDPEVLGVVHLASSAREELRARSEKVELNIKTIVGYGALVIMVIQVGIADLVFIRYAEARNWGDVPTGAIQAWLAATVVQVIAVVLVVARSVFPANRRSE